MSTKNNILTQDIINKLYSHSMARIKAQNDEYMKERSLHNDKLHAIILEHSQEE